MEILDLKFKGLILMEKDEETGFVTNELGSFEVGTGGTYVRKFFVCGEKVNLYFDTNKDVEEWEYSAIYDLFNYEIFEENSFEIEDDLEEFNPTFILKFDYDEDYTVLREKILLATELIEQSVEAVFKDIANKKEEYI